MEHFERHIPRQCLVEKPIGLVPGTAVQDQDCPRIDIRRAAAESPETAQFRPRARKYPMGISITALNTSVRRITRLNVSGSTDRCSVEPVENHIIAWPETIDGRC
jgi:hypothetical protein